MAERNEKFKRSIKSSFVNPLTFCLLNREKIWNGGIRSFSLNNEMVSVDGNDPSFLILIIVKVGKSRKSLHLERFVGVKNWFKNMDYYFS